jgi:hypothetical protein
MMQLSCSERYFWDGLRLIVNWIIFVNILLVLNGVKILDIPRRAHSSDNVSVWREKLPLSLRHDYPLIILVIEVNPNQTSVMLILSKSPFERYLLPAIANPAAILHFLPLNENIFRSNRKNAFDSPDIFYRNRVFLYLFCERFGRDNEKAPFVDVAIVPLKMNSVNSVIFL